MQCYHDYGVERKHLLTANDACVVCRADAGDGAIPLDAPFSSGNVGTPVHIQCRCMPAPAGINVIPPQAHLKKMTERTMISKESAHYRASDAPGRSCRTCVMFHSGTGTCDLVLGNIEPDDVCDHWEARSQEKSGGVRTVAFLLLRTRNADGKRRYLLQKRADDANHGGTWGLPGGELHPGETPWQGAMREATEEAGKLPKLEPDGVLVRFDEDQACYTYVCDVTEMFTPDGGTTPWESAGWGWFGRREVEDLPLHPQFRKTWDAYLEDVLGKTRQRSVLVSGQEIYPADDDEKDEDPPGGGGARDVVAHDSDGTEVAAGGTTGSKPPRWNGDEKEPFVAMPNGPAGAQDVSAGRVKEPPPAGGSAGGYRDGSEMTVRPPWEDENEDDDDAWWPLERGRPPNSVGKGAADYGDPNPVEAEHIYSIMRSNFPEKALEWVKRTHWIGPVQIPWERIDDDDEDKWAASHQPDAVNRFAREIKNGSGHLNPSILVQHPGSDRAVIVDGHHRALARRKLGKPVLAYVGFTHGKDVQAAEETHSSQFHSGSDPGNQ
jgi:8-oxo-dGTP diphosphatase